MVKLKYGTIENQKIRIVRLEVHKCFGEATNHARLGQAKLGFLRLGYKQFYHISIFAFIDLLIQNVISPLLSS